MSWTRNKCQASFKPLGRFIPASEVADPHALTLICRVNGKEVTRDSTGIMKFTIPQQVADASALTPLQRGDVLLTGAASLGPVSVGDSVEGCIEGFQPQYTVQAKLAGAKPAV